jgi:uroporphyrin-3 C-methyltransferase
MSDTGKPTDEKRGDSSNGPAAVPPPPEDPPEPSSETVAEPPREEPQVIVQRKSGFSGALALILSLLALAACAYLWLEAERLQSQANTPDTRLAALADQQRAALAQFADEQRTALTQQTDDQQAQLAALAEQITQLGQRVQEAADTAPQLAADALPAELEDLLGRLDALEHEWEENDSAIEALGQRLAAAESAAGTDPAILEEFNERLEQAEAARRAAPPAVAVNQDYLLDEVESYLRIANRQLGLAGNAPAAESALELADERLAQLDQPHYDGVRGAISDELAAVRGMEKPDLTGIALALSTLSDQIAELPVKGHSRAGPATAAAGAVEPQSGWDRFVASVQSALRGLVAVRRTDTTVEPLLPPDEVYFLQRNIELKLEVARLALLQHNEEVYRTSLRSVRSWLNEYFDTQDASVENALRQIADLEGKRIAPSLPDISGSLELLKQARLSLASEADAI